MNDVTKVSESIVGKLRARRPLLALLAGVLGIAAIAGWRLSERLERPEVVAPPPLLVETETVTAQPLVIRTRYSGSIEADRRAMLSSRLTSTVNERYVKEGDLVEAGQTLLRLDATEQEQELARLEAAARRIEADLGYWEKQLKIDRRLFREGTVSEQKLQDTRRQVAMLQASLEENRQSLRLAQTRLGYATVSAPFDGAVQTVTVDNGETVTTGTPLLELVDSGQLKAVLQAPQADRGRLSPGLRAYLHLHHLATEFPGVVGKIYPALDSVSRNVTLDIPLPAGLAVAQPGMSVSAEIVLARIESALTVPLQAVQKRNGETGVFVVHDEVAQWQPVETGPMQDNRVQLLSGISAGEQVITTPYPALQAGSAVRPDMADNTPSAE